MQTDKYPPFVGITILMVVKNLSVLTEFWEVFTVVARCLLIYVDIGSLGMFNCMYVCKRFIIPPMYTFTE